jgi:hypothetical protein
MTLRRISISTHGAFELLLGFALMGAPFALSFGATATVAALALGAVIVGLALGVSSDEHQLSLATHLALDQTMVAGLLAGVIIVGFAGDRAAIAALGAIAIAQALLIASTRYSRAR